MIRVRHFVAPGPILRKTARPAFGIKSALLGTYSHRQFSSSSFSSAELTVADQAAEVIQQTTSHGSIVSSVHELTLAIHDAAGIPWWATIIAVSAIPRILLVPVVAYQNRVSMLSALLAPKLNEIQNSLSRDSGGSSKEMMKKYRKATEEISSKYGYSLSMTLASLGASVIQIPISVTLFFAMLSQELAWKFPGITEGGAYWFTDLTKPDPTMIFPIISSISMISTIYLQPLPDSTSSRVVIMRRAAFVLSIASLYFTRNFPMTCHLMFTTTSGFLSMQSLLLRSSFLRKAFKIPDPAIPLDEQLHIVNPSYVKQKDAPELFTPTKLYSNRPRVPKKSK